MKKKILLIACASLILALPTLASCSSTSSSETTSSSSQQASDIATLLGKLRNGFSMDGTMSETAHYLTGRNGTETGATLDTTYSVHYAFEKASDHPSAERRITGENGDVVNDVCIEGDDGFVYYADLNYHNEVEYYKASTSSSSGINYGLLLDNPFNYILESDLTLKEGKTYSLDLKKASFFTYRTLGVADTIYDTVIDSFEFTINDNDTVTLNILPHQLDNQYYTDSSYNNVYYNLTSSTTLTLTDIGNATVTLPAVKTHKEEHDRLASALAKIDSNYTIDLTYTGIQVGYSGSSEETELHHKYYYTDEGAFIKFAEGAEIDPVSDVLIKYDTDGDKMIPYGYHAGTNTWTQTQGSARFNNMVGLSKSVIKPIVKDVAPELFTYDAELNAYVICDELKTVIGVDCFVPPIDAELDYLDGYGTSCIIYMDGDTDNIDRIVVTDYFDNSFLTRSESYSMKISNVGTTTLPYSFGD